MCRRNMLIVIILFGILAFVYARPLVKEKNWRDLAAFFVVFALAMVISVLNQLGTPIPSTILTMDDLMHKVGIFYK